MAAGDHALYSKTQSCCQKGDTPPETLATPGLRRSPSVQDRRRKQGNKRWRWWLGGFQSRQNKRREKGEGEGWATRRDLTIPIMISLTQRLGCAARPQARERSSQMRRGKAALGEGRRNK